MNEYFSKHVHYKNLKRKHDLNEKNINKPKRVYSYYLLRTFIKRIKKLCEENHIIKDY